MVRKTVIKRASNYWPKCHLVHEAVAVLNLHEGLAEEHLVKEVPATDSNTLNELLKVEPSEDFEARLNDAKTLKALKTVASAIAKSGQRSDELLEIYYKRKEELS